jgi:hypothetical protein
MKGIQTGKKENLSQFTDDKIYREKETPKKSTRKLLELISEFSKVIG